MAILQGPVAVRHSIKKDEPIKEMLDNVVSRAFFAEGVEKFALAAAVEVLPGLLRASVLHIGLVDFLLDYRFHFAVMGCDGMPDILYPHHHATIYPNSPYQIPLSSLCWFVLEATPLLGLWVRRRNETVQTSIRERRTKIGQGMRRALESKANRLDVLADTNALQWTLRCLDGDHKLEEILDGLPGLFHGYSRDHSPRLKGGLERLVELVADKLFETCTTGLLPEGLQRQRLMACLGAGLMAKVLERYCGGDESKIPAIDYLGVKPVPVPLPPGVHVLRSGLNLVERA
jgi:hypothetical protein